MRLHPHTYRHNIKNKEEKYWASENDAIYFSPSIKHRDVAKNRESRDGGEKDGERALVIFTVSG